MTAVSEYKVINITDDAIRIRPTFNPFGGVTAIRLSMVAAARRHWGRYEITTVAGKTYTLVVPGYRIAAFEGALGLS